MNTENTLPVSILTKNQRKTYGPRSIMYGDEAATITAVVRYDDECGNGHNSFSITATIRAKDRRRYRRDDGFMAGGCCHEEVAKHFPELAPFIKWHLFDSTGPMHYVANTVYHAGDRDHNRLRKGECRQMIAGRSGLPMWDLEAVNAPGVLISTTPTGRQYAERDTVPLFILDKDTVAASEADLPPVPVLRWVPCYTVGEGKPRDLNAARRCAVWPDATDEQLSVEPEALRAALLARLPALVAEFKAAVESLGFIY